MRFIKQKNEIYFDNAKMGPIYEELYNWRLSYESNLFNNKSSVRDGHEIFFNKLKSRVKSFFNAQNDDVLFSNSFTSGFNKLLSNIDKKAKFLCIKRDYPSISKSIKNFNFKLVELGYTENIENLILRGVIKHKPNVLVVSIVQYIDGLKLNLDFIKKLKQQFSDLIIIGDGTQYLGSEKFSLKDSGFDIVISSGYKWLFSGYGNAIMLFKKDFYKNKFVNKSRLRIHKIIESGHLDLFSFGSLNMSLSVMEKEIDLISNKIKSLSKKMTLGLKKRNLLGIVHKKRSEHSSIFNIVDNDGKLHKYLSERNIKTSRRGKGCRISLASYNSFDEIEKFLNLLDNFYHSTLNIDTPESELLP